MPNVRLEGPRIIHRLVTSYKDINTIWSFTIEYNIIVILTFISIKHSNLAMLSIYHR